MPWRNGGGTTTEIAIAPEGAALTGERFLWRLSIAEVSADGPFSRFEGYDRRIMLLEGAGMTLACAASGTITLRRFEPHAFSGDEDVYGTLVAGPVRDLNVIVDRARATAVLTTREVTSPETITVDPAEICLVYVISGDIGVAAANETLILEEPCELEPRADAHVAIARIRPL